MKALKQTEKENDELKKALFHKEVENMKLREENKQLKTELRISKKNHRNNQRRYR